MVTYAERKAAAIDANECIYPGCHAAPADDALECIEHRDRRRARVARSLAKLRARWILLGLCPRCGRPKPPGARLCPGCTIERGENNNVNKRPAAGARRSITEADGRTRLRFAGRGKRGRVGAAADDALDLAQAAKSLSRGIEGLGYARSEEVQTLPRIQREDAKQAALAQLAHAVRSIGEVLRRGKVRLADVIGEETDHVDGLK